MPKTKAQRVLDQVPGVNYSFPSCCLSRERYPEIEATRHKQFYANDVVELGGLDRGWLAVVLPVGNQELRFRSGAR